MDFTEEKKNAMLTEEKFDKYKAKMEQQEEVFKDNQKQMAKVEIENDELKNDAR